MEKGVMQKRIISSGIVLLFLLIVSCTSSRSSLTLFQFANDDEVKRIEPLRGASASVNDLGALEVAYPHAEKAAAVLLHADPFWNCGDYLYFSMDVRNPGSKEAILACRIEGNPWNDAGILIPAGESKTFNALIKREKLRDDVDSLLFAMNGLPGGIVGYQYGQIQADSILFIALNSPYPLEAHTLIVDNVRLSGSVVYPDPRDVFVFPFIDKYGQDANGEWPDKVKSPADLELHTQKEALDLEVHPGPQGWSRYGGWAGGPRLVATGHFRTEKRGGKWWLVDPEGYLFWSHGLDCVRKGANTPITGREHFFRELPEKNEQNAYLFGKRDGSPKGYYKDTPFETFDFRLLNLTRKYGDDWDRKFTEISQRRLRSWGINTIANWSDPDIYVGGKTPYTGTLHSRGRTIEGSTGQWGKFPDPFDESFVESLEDQFRRHSERGSCVDPFCIGFFIDNEMHWGDSTHLAISALNSPADQPARKAVIKRLKRKYGSIRAVGRAWELDFKNWAAIRVPAEGKHNLRMLQDLSLCNQLIAGAYFENCRRTLKSFAPDKLYLGCRFDFHFYPYEETQGVWVQKIAARYCDVVSFNRYRFTTADLIPPAGVDKPLIIGEFHFGSLDRGKYHPGLRAVNDQEQRAEFYRHYVESALKNPFLVGVHWFQYCDSATSGRFDGENYQIGFLDICDTPYWVMIGACREVGYSIYQTRIKHNHK